MRLILMSDTMVIKNPQQEFLSELCRALSDYVI